MILDYARVKNQVYANRLIIETKGRRKSVGQIARLINMVADRTDTQLIRFFYEALKIRDSVWVDGGIDIATSIEMKNVRAFMSQVFHNINATIHQADHGVPGSGPKVPITFGGFITRQRKGCIFVDQHDIFDSMFNGQVISRRNPGYPCPADNDICLTSLRVGPVGLIKISNVPYIRPWGFLRPPHKSSLG